MTGTRADALARLDVFAGGWVLEARFPGGQPAPASAAGNGPQARSTFEWALDRQFLVQRTEVPVQRHPDSLTIGRSRGSRPTSRRWRSGSASLAPSPSPTATG